MSIKFQEEEKVLYEGKADSMTRSVSFVIILLASLFLCSCGSKLEKEAQRLYEEAQTHFQNRNYEQTIAKSSEALDLTNDGKQTFTIKFDFFNGSIHYLRAQAYEALNENKEALEDYTTAIVRGNAFLGSYALNSDPEPYAKRKFKRNKLAKYYEARANLYRKFGEGGLAEQDASQASKWSIAD